MPASDHVVPAQHHHHAKKIHTYYSNPAIVAGYGRQDYITPCERLLFGAFIKPGMAILDIGVGGGRTSQYLARNASKYVGIDYSSEMVRLCRNRYPQWEYFEDSATDLSRFPSGSFDAVVMSYNMIDDLIPDKSRQECLEECYRVLRKEGVLIFSAHNPRAIFVRREQEAEKASEPEQLGRFSNFSSLYRHAMNKTAIVFTLLCFVFHRLLKYGLRVPFWNGHGYMLDSENLLTHFWTPKRAIAEVGAYGFRCVALQGDDYPKKSHALTTDWYYYVFQK
jgi:ubiquinone/menaquinone biosynthesis C-methylase UbiE